MTNSVEEIPSFADESVLLDWLATMRDADPVWQDKWGVWHVFRHADVQTVLRDTATYSSDLKRMIDGVSPDPGMIHEMDPPEHQKLRRAVSSAFTPRRIAELEPRIREVVRSYLEQAGERFDLVEELAFPLPATIIADLLGLHDADQEWFRERSEALIDVQLDDPTDPALNERVADILGPLTSFLRTRTRERRSRPGDDLMSALIKTQVDERELDDTEIANFSTALLLAGHITTTVLLGSIVRTLDEHKSYWAAARENPDLVNGIIEEVLRYRPPFPQMQRTTTAASELAGRSIPANVMVNVWVVSANRDPRAHSQPDTFDPNRSYGGAAQLSFGHGLHFCLGAPLARLENRVALEEIINRYDELEVDRSRTITPFDQVVLGVRNLPVRARD